MPKVKPKRKIPSIDMTAMVDVGFLLLTFFILTTKFRADEPVTVDTPSSVSTIKLPVKDLFQITVAEDGRILVGAGDQNTRLGMLDKMEQSFNFTASPAGKQFFMNNVSFGVPLQEMPQWLNQPSMEQMKGYPHRGIPVDIGRGKLNELKEWVNAARRSNARLRFAIKGDRETSYEVMEKVIFTLQDANINKFNLVTNMEADPNASEAEGGE
ncbi:MAG: biopolymer transporter ExbD [Bacteroidota bacterium]